MSETTAVCLTIVLLASLMLTCNVTSNRAILKMVEAGAHPIAAHCAVSLQPQGVICSQATGNREAP